MDPGRLRRGRLLRGRRREPGPGPVGPPVRAGPGPAVVLRRPRPGPAGRPGHRGRPRRCGRALRRAARRQPRHRDLHLGHDRASQGLPAHPRQPSVGDRQRAGIPAGGVHRGRVHAALPAAGARLRPGHRGGLRRLRGDAGPQHRREPADGRPGRVPADVHPRRPPRVREGLQRRPGQGDRPGQGTRLRQGGRRGHPLQPSLGLRAAGPAAAGPARRLRPVRLQQAAGRPGWSDPLRSLRRGAAGGQAGALLPRDRAHGARGVRPHRDQRRIDREHPVRPAGRLGRPADPRLGGADRR